MATFRLNLYSGWMCYLVFIELDGTAASCQPDFYSALWRYLSFYSAGWRCNIPLTSSVFIAVVITRVNGLVAVYPIYIYQFGFFTTHIICVFVSSSLMVFLSAQIICVLMTSPLMVFLATNILVGLLLSQALVDVPRYSRSPS